MHKLYSETEFNPTEMGFRLWSRGYELGYKEAKKEKADSEEPISEELREQIDLIYSMYPTKCLITKRSLGKSAKNKDKIKSLLTKSKRKPRELLDIITRYSMECKSSGTFMMNFTTFLNNLPDYGVELSPIEEQQLEITDEDYYLTEDERDTLTPDERLDLIYTRKKNKV